MVIYKKIRVIYHYEGKRLTIWLIFMVIFSNKIMQNYWKITPQKGNGNYPWCRGNGERVIPIYAVQLKGMADKNQEKTTTKKLKTQKIHTNKLHKKLSHPR